jgi:ribosomal protein S20
MTTRREKPAPYQVGYGKPPLHTRFQKGKSGNPSGRPRRAATERAKALALKEAYRAVTLTQGDNVESVPAIQAVLRSQFVLAVKGNAQAQRAFLAAVQAIELENVEAAARAAQEAGERAAKEAAKGPFNYTEAARRVSLLLRLAKDEQEEKAQAAAGNTPSGSDATPPDAHVRRDETGPR